MENEVKKRSQLAVVIPAYNEEGVIGNVITDWHKELERMDIDFKIHVYNDGSKDATSRILKEAASTHKNIVPHDKENSGHGPTVIRGYRENIESEWMFQVDSDDEMSPESFEELWKKREEHDFLIGERLRSQQPLSRKIVSLISRLVVWVLYGTRVYDVNSPFRLMRNEKIRNIISMLPQDLFAPNVIISGMVSLMDLRVYRCEVSRKQRTTGEVSIQKWKLLKAAMQSFLQTILFRFRLQKDDQGIFGLRTKTR